MKVGLVGHTAIGNAVGRVYSNWLALSACGIDPLVLLPEKANLWAPVDCDAAFAARITTDPIALGSWADVLVAHKPWPGSFDVALELGRRFDLPVVVDVDDPDFENQFGERRLQNLRYAASKFVHRDQVPIAQFRLRASIRRARSVTLSNPGLREWYGSSFVVPHARVVPPEPPAHRNGNDLEVCFVGTVREYKGIGQLRRAVGSVDRVRLTVTADAPPDAAPNENWVGSTSLADGIAIVSRSDVACIPTLASTIGRGQLPAKLVDGMFAGRAVVASDLPPISWALGGAGVLVPPGDVNALANALEQLKDVRLRQSLGSAARRRAESMFGAEVVGAEMIRALDAACISGA